MARTAGTNQAQILSTVRWMRVLLPWASCTILMIELRVVSFPTFSAIIRKALLPLMVPAYTWLPASLYAARGSPVSMLSSM